MSGPLSGIRVLEFAGLGPGPYAAMLLADMGADVIRIERADKVYPLPGNPHPEFLLRGRRNIAVDLKNPEGKETVMKLVEKSDAIIEGFRPGVMERLGLGPEDCAARNPKLVFGRMTGWGQDGPYAMAAGHDINYIALAGALAHFRRKDTIPTPPMNLVGDFGGGGMFLVFGIACALLEAQRSGKGQVVDAAMVDGVASLMTMFWGFKDMNMFDPDNPGTTMLDTGAAYYDVYETKDGKYISVGAIESQFYQEMLQRLGLQDDPDFAQQNDRSKWPVMHKKLWELFRTKTQAEWNALLEMTDICYAPVLPMLEAAAHPHNVERGTYVEYEGHLQPAPAPRYSRTPGAIQRPAAHPGQNSKEVLDDLGFSSSEIESLLSSGAIKQAQ